MDFFIPLSIAWIAIGVMGLLGFSKRAPKKFRDKPWTKQYIKYEGVTWILIALPSICFLLMGGDKNPGFDDVLSLEMLILAISVVPAIVYSIWVERKFSARLKEENEENCPDN